jgi:hypothetical protein
MRGESKLMNHVFRMTNPIVVPDGSIVNGFLNSTDNTSGVDFGLVESLSIAGGLLIPGVRSKLQILPLVTQVTFVRRGQLTVKMKDRRVTHHYTLHLVQNQAALTKPGTFLQLLNETDETCEVLYIVTPSYVFEFEENKVIYDDSVVFDESWEAIETPGWMPSKPYTTLSDREAAIARLRRKSQSRIKTIGALTTSSH